MAKPLLSFRPKPEVADAAKAMAAADRRPLGQWIANLVEDEVLKRQSPSAPTGGAQGAAA
jgi:hypothetical protein